MHKVLLISKSIPTGITKQPHFNETLSNIDCYQTLRSKRQTFVDHTIPDINRKDSEIILSHNAIENISFAKSSRFWNVTYFAIDHNRLSTFRIQKYLMFSTEIILANNNRIRIVLLDCTWSMLLNRPESIGRRSKLLDLSWNFISSIEYYNCKFDHLKLHHNLFVNDDILNIEDFHVERFDLSNNLLRNVFHAFYKLDVVESINLLGNPFTSHDFHPKPIAQLKELYLENIDRPLEYLNYGELDQLQILYVFKLVLRTRHLQNFELYSLNCSLADQVPELRVLSLIESDIHFIKSSLDIIPSTLEILNLSGNPLKYLDLTNIRNFFNLRIIDISDVISFDSGTTEYLNISNTSIPSVLIKNLTNLVVLNPYGADCPADILQIKQFSSA
ncbi:hypothetical protein GJ496_007838 [Pomphorhynchus laevis]|nr:hypothetical protein GJ496_007838 [Pomphorhynchus laevis]